MGIYFCIRISSCKDFLLKLKHDILLEVYNSYTYYIISSFFLLLVSCHSYFIISMFSHFSILSLVFSSFNHLPILPPLQQLHLPIHYTFEFSLPELYYFNEISYIIFYFHLIPSILLNPLSFCRILQIKFSHFPLPLTNTNLF